MLTLERQYPITITIDDEPVRLHVRRMSKAEGLAFEREFFRHGQPRGDQEETVEEKDQARAFIEDSIARFITCEPGQIQDNGNEVTSGEDLIRAFATRADVLGVLYSNVYSQNFLGKSQKKILSVQPFSFPGSARSMWEHAGEPLARTAGSVDSSDSARSEPVTGSNGSTAGGNP